MLDIDIQLPLDSFTLACSQQLNTVGITGILGHSGSGKTSLLRVIAGLNQHASGQLVFNNEILQDSQAKTFVPPEQRGIGFVFQDGRLFPHLTVEQNISFAAKRAANSQMSLNDICAMTKITALRTRRIDMLSAGEKQRVALARALIAQPKLLLLDEPLAHLDSQSRQEMVALLKHVQKELNLPMLYISHNIIEIQQLAHQVWVLADGEVVQTGNVHQVLNNLKDNSQSLFQLQTSLDLLVKQHHQTLGLTELQFATQNDSSEPTSIFIKLLPVKEHALIRCFVKASDISVCLSKPDDSSIVNELNGTIEHIDERDCDVFLKVNCSGQLFNVHISKYSFDKLSLNFGQHIFIQFKAGAVCTL